MDIIIIGILALMGLGFIFWLVGAGIKSGVSAMLPDVNSELESIRLYNKKSLSGFSEVKVAYRSKKTGACTANVVCSHLGRDEWTSAKNMSLLQKQVAEIYEKNDKELKEIGDRKGTAF